MNGFNEFEFIGYMPGKPELKKTRTGKSIVEFTFPTRGLKSADGSYETDWHRMIAIGAVADIINKYYGKGDQVKLKGMVREEKWTDDRGQTRYATKFLVDSVITLKKAEKPQLDYYSDSDIASTEDGGDKLDITADDLPF